MTLYALILVLIVVIVFLVMLLIDIPSEYANKDDTDEFGVKKHKKARLRKLVFGRQAKKRMLAARMAKKKCNKSRKK